MGYRFKKNGVDDFYIRLSDAGVVRASARSAGVACYMPGTETYGRTIPKEVRDTVVAEFRENAKLLNELADYMESAENLRWSH